LRPGLRSSPGLGGRAVEKIFERCRAMGNDVDAVSDARSTKGFERERSLAWIILNQQDIHQLGAFGCSTGFARAF